MKFTKIMATMLCSLLLFCGCAKNSDVVLKINDTEITRGEFYGDLKKLMAVHGKNLPKEFQKEDSFAMLSVKEKYIHDVIIRELAKQEFEKRKLTVSEEEFNKKKAELVAYIGSEEQFNNVLRTNGITQDKLKSDIESEVRIAKLIAAVANTKVSDAEAQKFYNANKTSFILPQRVRASHILIETNPELVKKAIVEGDKEAKLTQAQIDEKVKQEVERKEKLAKDLRQKAANNPKIFAQLARENSDDKVSALQGGDLGFITKDQVVKEFGDAVFSQKVGTVGPLVKSQFGVHIILVTDKAAGGVQSFASVKSDLKQYLSEKKRYESFQKYMVSLKDNAKIEYYDESLKPEVIKKQIEEALVKKVEFDKYKRAPKSKQKILLQQKENK